MLYDIFSCKKGFTSTAFCVVLVGHILLTHTFLFYTYRLSHELSYINYTVARHMAVIAIKTTSLCKAYRTHCFHVQRHCRGVQYFSTTIQHWKQFFNTIAYCTWGAWYFIYIIYRYAYS